MSLVLFFQIVVTSVVTSGAALAILAYLSKSLLVQLLAKELASFKTDLDKELHTFSTQFSRLDQQRALGIMQIHGLMCQIEHIVCWESGTSAAPLISVSPETDTVNALNKAWEYVGKLSNITAYHSLLLDEHMHVTVIEWAMEMVKLIADMGNEIEPLRKASEENHVALETRKMAIDSIRDKYINQYESQLASKRKGLEAEFREYLGLFIQATTDHDKGSEQACGRARSCGPS